MGVGAGDHSFSSGFYAAAHKNEWDYNNHQSLRSKWCVHFGSLFKILRFKKEFISSLSTTDHKYKIIV